MQLLRSQFPPVGSFRLEAHDVRGFKLLVEKNAQYYCDYRHTPVHIHFCLADGNYERQKS